MFMTTFFKRSDFAKRMSIGVLAALLVNIVNLTPANAQQKELDAPWSIKLITINAGDFKKAFINRTKTITADTLTLVKKNGRLSLPLGKGNKVVFTDNKGIPYDEARTHHTYIGRLKSLNSYLVKQNMYEGTNYFLIKKINGYTDTLAGLPALSADRKIMFCTYWNPYEEHDDIAPPTQDIAVYSVSNGNISKAYRISYSKMIITNFAWETNSSLVISYKSREEDPDNKTKYARLKLTH